MSLDGGADNDTYHVDDTGDRVNESDGDGQQGDPGRGEASCTFSPPAPRR